jgi:hypothetical protein
MSKSKTTKKPLKVAIIAGGAKEANFLDPKTSGQWEVWGLNAIRPNERLRGSWVRPITWARMFNLHRFEHLNRDCPEYIYTDSEWAKRNREVPFYVVDSWHGLLPNEHLFPIADLQSLPRGGLYHAGSLDMLVAYAVHLGAVAISLHGIGLSLDSHRDEPISARACLEYWCGVAEGRGRNVSAAPDCDIFYQYHLVRSRSVYGFDDVQLIERRP